MGILPTDFELFSLDTVCEGFSSQIQCLMDTRSPVVAFCSHLILFAWMLKLEKQSSLIEICLLRMLLGLLGHGPALNLSSGKY